MDYTYGPGAMEAVTRMLARLSLCKSLPIDVAHLPIYQHNSPHLSGLPTELVSLVCEGLDDLSILRLRLVCKKLADQMTFAFGSRFFDCVVAILHPTSLDILWKITHHAALSKFIQRVVISSENEMYGMTKDDFERHIQLLSCIFWTLPNLRNVRFDSNSFNTLSPGRCQGTRCGHAALDRESRGYDDSHESGYVLDILNALTALLYAVENSMPRFKGALEMHLTSKHGSNEEYIFPWLHTNQTLSMLHLHAEKLAISGHSFGPSVLGPLRKLKHLSITNIWRMELTMQGPEPTLLNWPELTHLEVRNVAILSQGALTEFLMSHRRTLVSIRLYSLFLFDRHTRTIGTWTEPIAVMAAMENLETLKLESSPGGYSFPLRPYNSRGPIHKTEYLTLGCHGRDAVAFSLSIILSETTSFSRRDWFPSDDLLNLTMRKATEAKVVGISLHRTGDLAKETE